MIVTAKWRNSLAATALAAALLLGSFGASANAQTGAAAVEATASENYASFLASKHGIQWSGAITTGSFIEALAKALDADKAALSAELKADAPLAAQTAVSLAVKAANIKELAYTYSPQKVNLALGKAKLAYAEKGNLPLATAQELAAAIDVGIVSPAHYAELAANRTVTAELASHLVGKALAFTGGYKNYLGYVADDDIYGKLYHAWTSSSLIAAAELQKTVDETLKKNLITGYNLKDARYNANFDPKLSITYGHSEIAHAIQLVGLLRSEGVQAKLQFEPKTSAYIYLKEWGEPKETADFKVVQIENGNYIAYAKEYDLSLEFASESDKQRFDGLIHKYAKKNEENAKGLLLGSWWQPLYSSLTELKEYKEITNNLITKGHYIAQSYSLSEKSADVIAGFKSLDSSLNVTSHKLWVDQPFYNYLLGDYK